MRYDLQWAPEDQQSMDQQLEREVDMLMKLAESYIRMVHTTEKDLVPKIIMKHIVCSFEDFVTTELPATLYRSQNDQVRVRTTH